MFVINKLTLNQGSKIPDSDKNIGANSAPIIEIGIKVKNDIDNGLMNPKLKYLL